MALTADQIAVAVLSAKDHKHPFRAMRTTLECSHIRLIPFVQAADGIGAWAACRICRPEEGERNAMRQVVNVEETGVLFPDWLKAQTSEVDRDGIDES